MQIGTKIRAIRERRYMTKKALAEACGISPYTLVRAESGRGSPSQATLVKIAKALDVNVECFSQDELFEGSCTFMRAYGGRRI